MALDRAVERPMRATRRGTVQLNAQALALPTSIPVRKSHFATLYEQYVVRVYRFVYGHVGNREDAEDITSQVFIKVYNNLEQFEGRGRLENWLFQIARMSVADFWRERYKLPSVPLADGQDISSPAARSELDDCGREERVRQLLDRLPANYRRLLELRFLQRCSIAEVARAMNMTEMHARVMQFRALRRAADLGHQLGW